jgi:uncharacterized membrane protein
VTEPTGEPARPTGFGAERDPGRAAAFSDAVIAIAITLLVLEIRPPQDSHHMLHGLTALWPSYLSYVLTFLLIGQIWANHHVMFDHIRGVDRVVLFLNTLLLMDIAFLPFAAAVLAEAFRDGQGQRIAVVLHGIAFELAAILSNVIWEYARHNRRLLASTIDPAGARHQPALPPRSWLARHRNPAGRRTARTRNGCDRGLHHLLLVAHSRRDRQGEPPA